MNKSKKIRFLINDLRTQLEMSGRIWNLISSFAFIWAGVAFFFRIWHFFWWLE